MSEDTFDIREVPIATLVIPEYCRRSHPKDQIDRCVRSLELHGQYQPIIVSGDEILCGVLVYKALKKMGRQTIWVHDLGDLTDERKREIRYLDNQIFDIESWDGFKIKDLLMSLDRLGVEKIGFTEEEVDLLINMEEPENIPREKSEGFHDIWECDGCGWRGTLDEAKRSKKNTRKEKADNGE